jgi:hypothetical protein
MAEAGTLVVRAGQDAAADALHWLPVKTSYTGPCNTSEFFKPTPDQGVGAGRGRGGRGEGDGRSRARS